MVGFSSGKRFVPIRNVPSVISEIIYEVVIPEIKLEKPILEDKPKKPIVRFVELKKEELRAEKLSEQLSNS
jgi:hypothetical protein